MKMRSKKIPEIENKLVKGLTSCKVKDKTGFKGLLRHFGKRASHAEDCRELDEKID